MSFNEPGLPGSVSPPPYTPAAPSDWPPSYGDGEGTSEQGDSDSPSQVAKQEAGNVAQSASGAAQEVASATKEQASSVASDAKDQAKQLAGQTRDELSQQVSTGKERAVSSLRSLSKELRGMAEGGEGSGPATELARQASSTTDQIASFLEEREAGQILGEVRDFARRRPGAFLLGAAVAGVVLGRLTRGAVSSASSSSNGHSEDSGNGASSYGSPGAATSTPAYGTPAPVPPGTPGGAMGGDLYGRAAPTPYPTADQGPWPVNP